MLPRVASITVRHLAVAALAIAAGVGGGAASAASPPRSIVFTSDRSGGSALYAINPSTGALAVVAPADAESPVAAAGLDEVAYQSFEHGQSHFYVTSPGGTPVELAACEGGVWASWSPDGTRLACDTGRGIDVVTADGTHSAVLITGDYTAPSWSPDGRLIAFAGGCSECTQQGLWVMPASGGAPTRLFAQWVDWGSTIAWSPDSTSIAFQSSTGNGAASRLIVVNAAGGTPRRLATGHFQEEPGGAHLAESWFPGGHQIALGSTKGIDLVDTASGAVRRLTQGHDQSPVWSPDGTELAFIRLRASSHEWDIGVVRANGTGLRLLTHSYPDGGTNTDPVWSAFPAGNVVPRPASRLVTLTAFTAVEVPAPVKLLTADGPQVAFTSAPCGTQMWQPPQRPVRVKTCDLSYAPNNTTLQLALAGNRISWVEDMQTIDQYEYLETAAPPYSHHVTIASLYADDTGGDQIGGLVGAGSTFAFEDDAIDGSWNVVHRTALILDRRRTVAGRRCPDFGGPDSGGSARGCVPLGTPPAPPSSPRRRRASSSGSRRGPSSSRTCPAGRSTPGNDRPPGRRHRHRAPPRWAERRHPARGARCERPLLLVRPARTPPGRVHPRPEAERPLQALIDVTGIARPAGTSSQTMIAPSRASSSSSSYVRGGR
jgi:Tol biopolymer transport system component